MFPEELTDEQIVGAFIIDDEILVPIPREKDKAVELYQKNAVYHSLIKELARVPSQDGAIDPDKIIDSILDKGPHCYTVPKGRMGLV